MKVEVIDLSCDVFDLTMKEDDMDGAGPSAGARPIMGSV